MTTFYLIRHATNDLVSKAIAGWTEIHLNTAGREQAERLARALARSGIDHIYSSPLERAQETAQPLARQLGLEIRIAEAIGELQFGEWTGKRLDELASDSRWLQWNRFRSASRIPGGETMLELQARFTSFLSELCQAHPAQTVALFSHGDPIRAVLFYFLGIPIDFIHRLEISPASVSVLRLGPDGPQLLCVNQLYSPLPAA